MNVKAIIEEAMMQMYSINVHRTRYQLVENEVRCKQHKQAELIALTNVSKPCYLVRKTAETSAGNQNGHLVYIAANIQTQQHTDTRL